MKICDICHNPNRDEAKFCRVCGSLFTGIFPLQVDTQYLHLQSGSVVDDRYQIIRQIGESGLGRVYMAVDKSGRKYAIKQIRERHTDDDIENYDVYIRSFQREADILSSLPHPYLPIVRDFVFTPNNFLIVMDYVEGKTLSEIQEASKGPLPENRVIQWAIQICEALSYLHCKKPPIIHRNIKPKNIILEHGDAERIHLIGFGLARYYVEGLERDEDNLGTHGYSPPEQYGRAQTDARSDIFSLGATMLSLLTKRDPGEFVNYEEPNQPIFKYPDPRSLNPQLSTRTSQVIQKALQLDPDNRYQSAEAMRTALEEILIYKQSGKPIENFQLNQPVTLEETRYFEFKEIKGTDPIRAIKKIVDEYVVAFLNAEGGRIFWGIRDDDRVVLGVRLNYRQRDITRRVITDKIFQIQPAIAPSAYRINFHNVLTEGKPIKDLYVIEVVVQKPRTNLLYFTGAGEVFLKTDAGKKKLSGSEIHDEILRRLQKGSIAYWRTESGEGGI